ncbi:30S ribosome-binding factor RbfA [candidate division WOR-3 bacterium]|nr:30S ribosome-binding factor RbfA [candidate division WOR-3 bacterium]
METVSEIIEEEIRDPRIGLVTIISAKTSSDLRHTNIFFTVHGGEEEGKKNEKLLNRASGFVQCELAKRLNLRYTPKIHFEYNPALERIERIEFLLKGEREEESEKSN